MKIGDCLVVAKLHTSRVLLVFIIFNVACIEVLLFFYHFFFFRFCFDVWVIRILLWGIGLFFCVRLLSHIPQSWLPDKWSDFSFWPAKIRKTMEAFRWYIVFPKTMAQAERLMGGIGCIIKCGGAVLLIGAV